MRRKGQKSPAGVAYNKLQRLDDTLQREREKRHIMGKAEFRRKMLRRLHHVRLDEESGAGLQGETSAQKE
jgi:hypothetical protein